MENSFVFVYGSLKKGYWNNYLLEGSEFIGEAITTDSCFIMRDVGFPYLFSKEDLKENCEYGKIWGEVYKIDDKILHSLDVLEGVSHNHYKRGTVSVEGVDKKWEEKEVYTYFAGRRSYFWRSESVPSFVLDHNLVYKWG